jgi:serine/threonine protein kinase
VFARKLIPKRYDNKTAENEIRAMVKLCNRAHRNLITVFGHGEFDNATFMFIDMELCHMNLDEYNKASWTVARFDWDSGHESRLWKIMYQIANGLVFIHENGEIHRDLKPSNGTTHL